MEFSFLLEFLHHVADKHEQKHAKIKGKRQLTGLPSAPGSPKGPGDPSIPCESKCNSGVLFRNTSKAHAKRYIYILPETLLLQSPLDPVAREDRCHLGSPVNRKHPK